MKLHEENELFFITEDMAAEAAAVGYEFKPPGHARRESATCSTLFATLNVLDERSSVNANRAIPTCSGWTNIHVSTCISPPHLPHG